MKEYSIDDNGAAGICYEVQDINDVTYYLWLDGDFYSLYSGALRLGGPEKDLILSYDADPELENPCILEAWQGDFRLIIKPDSFDFLVNNTNITTGDVWLKVIDKP